MKVRVVVVSHAGVRAANQSVYARLGADEAVTLVVPARWRDELRPTPYRAERLASFDGAFVPVRTWGLGRPQRHVYVGRAGHLLTSRRAQFLLVEEEPFSLAAREWSRAARRRGIPYAVQVAENLPRALPAVVRASSRAVLEGAAFVLARSPAALARAREWGYRGPDSVVPHGVSDVVDERRAHPSGVVGFVGRLVPAKGVGDLVASLRAWPDLQLRVAGDGPLRDALATLGPRVTHLGTLDGAAMADFYDSISVLAVPSRTTATWSEQFGRVLVEAQARATPVVAFASGEIPWVASQTAVQLVDEGDVEGLGARLHQLASDPALAARVGEGGRAGVARAFTDEVLAASVRERIRAVLTAR